MCLAIPAKIEEKDGDTGWVSVGEARVRVNLVMTPDAGLGDWILVHAGFAIQQVDEDEARETWQIVESLPEEDRRAFL